jgi:hypothetical protein
MRKLAAAFPGHAPGAPAMDDFRPQWHAYCFEKSAIKTLMQRLRIMVAAGIFKR